MALRTTLKVVERRTSGFLLNPEVLELDPDGLGFDPHGIGDVYRVFLPQCPTVDALWWVPRSTESPWLLVTLPDGESRRWPLMLTEDGGPFRCADLCEVLDVLSVARYVGWAAAFPGIAPKGY